MIRKTWAAVATAALITMSAAVMAPTSAYAGKWDNLVVMREKAKTDAFKKTQYAYYLDKYGITDADVVAYGVSAGTISASSSNNNSSSSNNSSNNSSSNNSSSNNSSSNNSSSNNSSNSSSSNGGSWKMFKGFRYNSMPSLANCGVDSNIKILYVNELFGSGSRSQPNVSLLKNTVAKNLLKTNPAFVVIDIEHWDQYAEMDKFITVVRTLKEAVRAGGNTKMKFGYYMMVPDREYNAPVYNKTGKMAAWQAKNDKLARLAKEVDVIFPSLYTIFNAPSDWVKYAKANISEARQYGKPVYAFIWPQFHDYNDSIGTQYLPVSYWQLQLETLRGITDGVVIWGSIKPNKATSGSVGWDSWNKNLPWWTATKAYAKKHSSVAVGSCNE